MPLYLHINAEGGNKIGVWHITESLEELHEKVELSDDDKTTLNTFRFEPRKKEWLAVRVLVKELLGCDYQICYKNSGAPYFKDKNLHIGISHTNGFAGVSVAPFTTALDMEKASPRIERVYQRFVNDGEMLFIQEQERISYYNAIWAAKETLFKLFDRQKVIFKENFVIEPFVLSEEGEITAHVNFKDIRCYVLMRYKITPYFTLIYYLNSFENDI